MSPATVTGTQLEELADADLVLRARHGDGRATEVLVARYRGAVRARASPPSVADNSSACPPARRCRASTSSSSVVM